jgi:hypothetical protein
MNKVIKFNKKMMQIKTRYLHLCVIAVLISCGSEPPPIDRSSSSSTNSGILGVWNFEKKECINADGSVKSNHGLNQGESLSVDIKDQNIAISYKMGAARNNCVVTLTFTVLEKKDSMFKMKSESASYSNECNVTNPPALETEEITYNYELNGSSLTLITESDSECQGLKSKEYFKR